MSPNELYQFILCLITFVMLTSLFTALVVWIVRLKCKLIDSGVNDEKIKDEYIKSQAKKQSIIGKIFDKFVLVLCCTIFLVAFSFSLIVSANEGKVTTNMPSLNVVKSSSMSYINAKHKYLKEGQVGGQMQMFDLVLIGKLPKEKDLKVNDIVVYEVDGVMIIHRIVAIEEPNDKHTVRHFLLHGDANQTADVFPVLYSQMKGIYTGTRVPLVGSFIMFMQSPSGYLCILLMIFAIVAVPVAENNIKKRTNARLMFMGLIKAEQSEESSTQEQIAVTGTENADTYGVFDAFGESKSFEEKLNDADDKLKSYYRQIVSTLYTIERIRCVRGFKGETYRAGNNCVCKLTIRGKTLNVYLGLNPKDFENTKYIYQDVSDVAAYKNYAMRVKLTSDRQVRWAQELIQKIVEQKGLTIAPAPVVNLSELFKNFNKGKTFEQKLNSADLVVKNRYLEISNLLNSIDKVRVTRGKNGETYRVKNTPICKITIRGKTLNVYLGLNPKDYENTKYIYKDVSDSATYKNYSMRMRITSDRQERWVKELINKIIEQNGFVINQVKKEQTFNFADKGFVKKKDVRSFKQKLSDAPQKAKDYYSIIEEKIKELENYRVIDGKARTFKSKNVPIARLSVRGKTLNAYLGLDPKEFENSKYIFTDVSLVKKYSNYPMRIKLTSDRQARWTKELIDILMEKNALEKGERND